MRNLIDEAKTLPKQKRSILPEELCSFHRHIFVIIMKYLKTRKLDGKLH